MCLSESLDIQYRNSFHLFIFNEVAAQREYLGDCKRNDSQLSLQLRIPRSVLITVRIAKAKESSSNLEHFSHASLSSEGTNVVFYPQTLYSIQALQIAVLKGHAFNKKKKKKNLRKSIISCGKNPRGASMALNMKKISHRVVVVFFGHLHSAAAL